MMHSLGRSDSKSARWVRRLFLLVVSTVIVIGLVIVQGETKRRSALVSAAADGNMEQIQKLVRAGVSVNVKANDGWTPLTISVVNGHYAVVQYLLEHGADVNMKEAGGKSPLFWANYYHRSEIAELLVEKGAQL